MRTPRPGLADLSKTCIYAQTSTCLRCWKFYLAWLDGRINALALKLAWNWLLRLYSMPKPTIPLSLWCKGMGMGMCPIFLFHCLVGPVDVTIVQVCLVTDQLSVHQKILKIFYIYSYWAFCCKGTGVALQILIIALGSPGCIYLTAPERWLYQHFEIFKHCIVKEETTEGWKTLIQKYSLNLNRWPSLEVHHWATILRFVTTIWFLQQSLT